VEMSGGRGEMVIELRRRGGGMALFGGNARGGGMLWVYVSFKGAVDSPSGMLSSKTGLLFSIQVNFLKTGVMSLKRRRGTFLLIGMESLSKH